jgi:hypothetical protein
MTKLHFPQLGLLAPSSPEPAHGEPGLALRLGSPCVQAQQRRSDFRVIEGFTPILFVEPAPKRKRR